MTKTVSINDDLHSRAKSAAAIKKISLSVLVERAITKDLE